MDSLSIQTSFIIDLYQSLQGNDLDECGEIATAPTLPLIPLPSVYIKSASGLFFISLWYCYASFLHASMLITGGVHQGGAAKGVMTSRSLMRMFAFFSSLLVSISSGLICGLAPSLTLHPMILL